MYYNSSLSRLTNEQLIISGVYLGSKCSLVNVKLKAYLLGYRNRYHFLNIFYSYLQWKVVIKLLINLFASRQKILVIKDLDFYKLTLSLNCKNIFFYDKKWIGGNLTNFRRVRTCEKFLQENLTYNSIGNLRFIPSLFFFFNTYISKWALWESYNLEIPIAGVINSNSPFFEIINYPIVGNNDCFEALYLYINILKNAYIKGKQKEQLKILALKYYRYNRTQSFIYKKRKNNNSK